VNADRVLTVPSYLCVVALLQHHYCASPPYALGLSSLNLAFGLALLSGLSVQVSLPSWKDLWVQSAQDANIIYYP